MVSHLEVSPVVVLEVEGAVSSRLILLSFEDGVPEERAPSTGCFSLALFPIEGTGTEVLLVVGPEVVEGPR